MKTAAIYTRTATDNQRVQGRRTDRNRELIETQIARCHIIAQKHGYQVKAVFADCAESGLSNERPALSGLLRVLDKGKFDAVVAVTADRLSRDLLDLISICEQLHNSNVAIVTEQGELAPTNWGG